MNCTVVMVVDVPVPQTVKEIVNVPKIIPKEVKQCFNIKCNDVDAAFCIPSHWQVELGELRHNDPPVRRRDVCLGGIPTSMLGAISSANRLLEDTLVPLG
eukprot:1371454-Amphidinium_carterae.1